MIYGDVIRLRALERSDVPTFARWFNDPQVRRTLMITDPLSLAEEEQWFEDQLRSENKIFGIEIPTDGSWTLIGNVGLTRMIWKDRLARAGLVIGEKDQWGKGFGRDALRTLARYAFEEMNLHRLELEVFDFNERARRCYRSCGFQHEGIRREALFRGGRYHDVIVMGLLARELKGS